ncbi:MAG: hypothetical protein K9M97_12185, partial [Akkermansiaceae bacterium]|nr:hypothetical protein [Akkermansiaceae bacterium]
GTRSSLALTAHSSFLPPPRQQRSQRDPGSSPHQVVHIGGSVRQEALAEFRQQRAKLWILNYGF